MSEESSYLNRHVGENVREQRELRGWSQSELARRMNDQGWEKYSQMTVSRTEDAARALRLDEAAVLARVLGTPLESLLVPPRQLDIIRELEKDTKMMQMDFDVIVDTAKSLIGQRRVMEAVLGRDDVRAESSDLGVKRRTQAEQALMKCTLKNAMETAIWQAEEDAYGAKQAAEKVEAYGSLEAFTKAVMGYDGMG